MQVVPILLSRFLGEISTLGSTLQSVKRGEKTGIDYLNDEVVALEERIGTPTPFDNLTARTPVPKLGDHSGSGANLPLNWEESLPRTTARCAPVLQWSHQPDVVRFTS